MSTIPLTKLQKEIMVEFYKIPATKVVYNKFARNILWKQAMKRNMDIDFDKLKNVCPALHYEIQRSYESGKNIQSAIFSECVYAQTLANMLDLKLFINCYQIEKFISDDISRLLCSYHLVPRYVYSSEDKNKMLIQAGGPGGIDSALITVIDLVIYTIEFKEPNSKTSELDLPKYGEDGFLLIDDKWLRINPHFTRMLEEQKNLNFFENLGNNIHNFSKDSINFAVSNNYVATKKYADVICTEDEEGLLTMIPANQISLWAEIEGEIRPAGRNHYNVWTIAALRKTINQKNGIINENKVIINKQNLIERIERGGDKKISGYKINPIFFIYAKDCVIENNNILTFDIEKVRQLNPTIAAKIFFRNLSHDNVKKHYGL